MSVEPPTTDWRSVHTNEINVVIDILTEIDGKTRGVIADSLSWKIDSALAHLYKWDNYQGEGFHGI